MRQTAAECDVFNIIHVAKLERLGEMHTKQAKANMSKMYDEFNQAKRERFSCKKTGIKSISRAIEGSKAQPLVCVERDRNTSDGGKKGEITSNPRDIDAVVKRAWQAIHDGANGCIETAVEAFVN